MILDRKKTASVLSAAFIACAFSACAERDPSLSSAGESSGVPSEEDLSPVSRTFIYPEKWRGVEIRQPARKDTLVKIDAIGHFSTTKNYCQQPADGVFELSAWNAMSNALNQIAATAPLPSPRCVDWPTQTTFWDGDNGDLMLEQGGKRKLFEYKNLQVCTTIADADLAKQVITTFEKTLYTADRTGDMPCGQPPQPR